MNPLKKQILLAINDSGPMSLMEYIKTCLTDDKYGYYTTKQSIFNKGGDFITASEASNLFSEVVSYTDDWNMVMHCCTKHRGKNRKGQNHILRTRAWLWQNDGVHSQSISITRLKQRYIRILIM